MSEILGNLVRNTIKYNQIAQRQKLTLRYRTFGRKKYLSEVGLENKRAKHARQGSKFTVGGV